MICITLWGKAASDDGGENDFMTEDLGFLVKMLFSTNIMAMFFYLVTNLMVIWRWWHESKLS